jgi:dienelactone hydrolase
MKTLVTAIYTILFLSSLNGQEIIELPYEQPTDITWEGGEKEYFTELWQTKVVTNVSKPTLQIFRPDKTISTGTSVIIAPGGGLFAHSIESEGTLVAQWLVKKGITALVLKYRLLPSGEQGVEEHSRTSENDPDKEYAAVKKLLPYSVADGLKAIEYTRSHASELDIDPEKIGFMGFSAGGAVTMGVAYGYKESSHPDFLVPVYAWTDVMPVQKPQKDAPPMLLICATDDSLGLAAGTIDLYNSWYSEKLNVGLHMYSKGDHGFGMRTNNLPSDHWIERFYDWAVAEGLTDLRN